MIHTVPLKRISIVLLAFLIYTIEDIIASPLWTKFNAYDAYFPVWQLSLLGFAVLIGLGFKSFLMPLSLVVLAWNGTEDLFFYVLQLKSLPDKLPWVTSPLVVQPATWLSIVFGTVWGMAVLGLVGFQKR